MRYSKLFTAAALAILVAAPTAARRAAADDDEKISITGCVLRADGKKNATLDKSLIVWSKGDVMLTDVVFDRKRAVGTSGTDEHVFYWLDDAEDLSKYGGQQVEISGELDGRLGKGELEIKPKDTYTQLEFDWDGKDVKARVPVWMFGNAGADREKREFDIAVRRIDVEKVRLISTAPCR